MIHHIDPRSPTHNRPTYQPHRHPTPPTGFKTHTHTFNDLHRWLHAYSCYPQTGDIPPPGLTLCNGELHVSSLIHSLGGGHDDVPRRLGRDSMSKLFDSCSCFRLWLLLLQ
ncbi:hypothetical protein BDV41DRAFT_362419 [Aspergillus transmontanensis]|uniref:Uncharacterized protein n=1 Tax=Aspergillus transmontanensis TaxID=1034304 RepID=A0A5N6VQV4_9EURO|nr:hypothetical protein BDV41DRAFT_362419 [Aspergillus transmontanensis]